jgi:hypothetical protein
VTLLRRRLLNGVGGALLIVSLFGAGCQSHTTSEPIGKLSREDTIAYLVLSDQLTPIREATKVPLTVCISSGRQSEEQSGYSEPSAELMVRLIEENSAKKSALTLKPASGCAPPRSAVADNPMGSSAFYVYSSYSANSRHPECGPIVGGWHGGGLYGGGNYYTVSEAAGEASVTRSDKCWFAE